jgi:spermidine/putrescine transport system ATP-binding protein
MLELKGVEKFYGSVHALRRTDLTIRDGEFFSLLGPSGCGKTTLLRMLGGFESPSSGQIIHNGKRIDNLPANQRQFNMVFQRYALFPHLSVWDNIAFGLRMKKVPESEVKTRVAEALALVKMESYGPRGINTLSGGQQQRIALARALVNRPQVLLLDEPLSALDLKLRQQMQVELLSLQRRLKHTFLFVTHDQEEALTLSDRIAVMNGGVVEQVGTAQEIYEYPRTPFVAQFIGQINSVEGEVREARPDAIVVQGASKRVLLVKPSRDGSRRLPVALPGTPVKVLVRPEKLKLLKSAPDANQNAIEGTLKEVLYQGPVTQLFVQPREGSGALLIVSQPNTAVTARRQFQLGDKVYVAWLPEDCLLMGREAALPVNESPLAQPATPVAATAPAQAPAPTQAPAPAPAAAPAQTATSNPADGAGDGSSSTPAPAGAASGAALG